MSGSIRLCLAALSLALFISPASAGTITYNWFGVVDDIAPGTTPGVGLGQTIRISLTLGDGVSDGDPSPEVGRYDATIWSPNVLVLAVDIGGRTDTGMVHDATVLNDHNGQDGFSILTSSPMTGGAFQFDFSTADLAVLSSDAIPLVLDPDAFSTARFTVFEHGPPLFSGRLLATAPLPGSIGLFISALTGLIGAGWWKARRPHRS